MNNNYHPGLHMSSDGTHPGMANEGVPIMSRNPIIDEAESRLYNDAQPATDYSQQPTINPQAMQPDTWIEGGTVLSDTTFSYGDYGVVEHNNMSRNTTDQWEIQMKAAQLNATQGKSRYNTPVTQTPSVAPNIVEPPKPTPEQLAKLKVRDRLINLNSRLKTLTQERQVASLKLAAIDRNLQSIKDEFEELQ